jgi:UDP-arabinose 4-epimerase
LERGDLLCQESIASVLKRYKPAAVLHFAGYAYVEESIANPLLYYRQNVDGIISLLYAMHDAGVNTLVFSSSCAVYGRLGQLPINERAPLSPINAYGAAKAMVERIVADASKVSDLKWTALRYFNAAGADEGGDLGEAHDPEPHVIPRLLSAADKGECFEIFGDDYPTSDGTCVRDYTHVSDIAEAHVRALAYLFEGGVSRVFNVGTGRGYSVRELIDAVTRVTGHEVAYSVKERRSGDPAELVADITDAKTVLNFTARRTSIDNILQDAFRWRRRRT